VPLYDEESTADKTGKSESVVVVTEGYAIDFFDDGSFVTSSTSLIGDIADIFFKALEIFS
jgi:hypothetical protein